MKKKIILLLTALVLLGLTGCSGATSIYVVQSNLARVMQPVVAQEDFSTLVEGNTEFAFDLYHQLSDTEGNLFYSPYSISEALAMTWAGAAGSTEQAMSDTMNYTLSQDNLHPAFNSLDLQLKDRGEGAEGRDGEGFRLNVVNATWGQKDYDFLDSYLDTLAENYGSGLRLVDFIDATEETRTTINDWVSEQTEERIKDLIPQGVLNNLTRLVLTNAIYFNAAWMKTFDANATQDGTFTLLDGSEITVPLMYQQESFRYTDGDGFKAVELPYDGGELSMVVLLPDEGNFGEFEAGLDADTYEDIIGSLTSSEVRLTMPKWEYDSSFSLKKALSDMGMSVAFGTDADFSGMTGTRELMIQDVLHKAFVLVDEEGTEAAAATAVLVGLTAAPMEVFEMKIDRPFIYVIRDIPTGSVIFTGRVVNPAD